MDSVQPYQIGTKWRFASRTSGYEFTEELVLYPEVDGSACSDDYLPEEISAVDLWAYWIKKYASRYSQERPTEYRQGEVPILWTATTTRRAGIFESAPYQLGWTDFPDEDFLTHFTTPVHAKTGEDINWLRLRVLDKAWNSKQADKGGFIQEATGWKPSPLQRVMNYIQIGRASGMPTL